MTNRPIFLDAQATTELDPIVAEAMEPFHSVRFGNPHSLHNEYGRDVAHAIDESKTSLASAINADEHELFYTSGATESNNWLVHNIAIWSRLRKIHLILSAIEHASLTEPLKRLNRDQVDITFLTPGKDGLISVTDCEACIQENTVLISVMAVNNEIGVIQPLREIGELCERNGVLFHTDASQAIGKIPFDVRALNLDFVSLSSHKVYGPMGIGALYISEQHVKRFEPMIIGGGQQRGLRSGTLPVSLCVGFGKAYELASERHERDERYLRHCRDELLVSLLPYQDQFKINGSLVNRVAGNLNIQFRNHLAEHFLVTNPQLAFSLGSACKATSESDSHVLAAIGLSSEQIERSFRLSFARTITKAEVKRVSEVMASYLRRPQV